MPFQRKTPIYSLPNFLFLNFTNALLFSIKSPNFRYSLILTFSFHFWYLQSANIRHSNLLLIECRFIMMPQPYNNKLCWRVIIHYDYLHSSFRFQYRVLTTITFNPPPLKASRVNNIKISTILALNYANKNWYI